MSSTELFAHHVEATEKFDYFICGVTGAIFAYVVQHYTPSKLAFSPSVLEPVGLVLLVAAFFVGLKRIEVLVSSRRGNYLIAQAGEQANAALKAQFSNDIPIRGGTVVSAESAEAQRHRAIKEREALEKKMDVVSKKGMLLYRWRNYLLMAGFIALLAAKILEPYSNVVPPKRVILPSEG